MQLDISQEAARTKVNNFIGGSSSSDWSGLALVFHIGNVCDSKIPLKHEPREAAWTLPRAPMFSCLRP